MKKPIYSIIIPHKNCPGLLRRCIDSIPRREDTQIIVVDDNSDTDIVDFDSFPGKDRNDVEIVYNKTSSGAGTSRNIGMNCAKGKWLMFADSDDYYTDAINQLMDKYANDNTTDLVILNAQGINKNNNITALRMNMYIDNFLKGRFYSEKVVRYGMWTPWSRMVKRALVEEHNLQYENIPTGNDVMFCLQCSKYAKSLKVERDIVYNYYMPEGRSLTYEFRKKVMSLKPRVELSFRMDALYNEVEYIFKPNHFLARRNVPVSEECKEEYLSIYNSILKQHCYSDVKDLFRFILFCFGRTLKII